VVVAYPDETLYQAAAKMLRADVGRLPVVDRTNPRRILGYIGRPQIMAAHRRRFEQEHVREPGWIGRFRRAKVAESQTR
jgi:CBS domain-containing protein